ncbi:hypothetical protein K440DRAFT_622054 [Wilcoxina mikolae CBS 423.85]|nr:hypothetical protein K440DRAFT_622054 [Wilcoxina mikolae CBS 423.85]
MAHEFQHPLLLPLHHAVLFLSLLSPPFRHRTALSSALIIATFVPLCLRPISSDPAASYGAATLWVLTLKVLTIHLFSTPSPESALYRPRIEAPGSAASYSPLKKAGWVFSLICAQRGVGWNNMAAGVTSTTSLPHYRSAGTYIRWALCRVAMIYLLLDLARTFSLTQPYMLELSDPGFVRMGDPSRSIRQQLQDMCANGASAWGYMEMQYLLLSSVLVAVGSTPENWPPLFGGIREGWSLQQLWGRVWHQMLRNSLVPWGKAAYKLLGLEEGSAAATAVMFTVGFGMSATGHALAIWIVDHRLGGGAAAFFLMQGVGIGVENLVCWLYGKIRGEVGEKWWGKVVGFIWVVIWVTWTTPWQGNEFVEIGLFKNDPVPWSPIRSALALLG